jgi:hypothetical protein
MLKSIDHDSMSGEHVGITSGMIFRSGKSRIWPFVALENHGFGNLLKFPREGKDLRKNEFGYMAYVRRENVAKYAWGKKNLSLAVMNTIG